MLTNTIVTDQNAAQSRWRSKPAWIAVFAIIGFVLGNWGLFDVIGLTDESWKQFVELLLACMAAFGVFNNPTSKNTF